MKSTVAVFPLTPELGSGLALSEPPALLPPDLSAESRPKAVPAPDGGVEIRRLKSARRAAIDRFEAEYVRELLQRSRGNVTKAAVLADVSRQVIHKLIAKHRL